MSIRRFSFIMTTVAVFVLVCAICLNTFYVRPLFEQVYNLREDVLAYEVVLSETKLPIGVLRNVEKQFTHDKDMTSERAAKLKEAYDRNYSTLRINQSKISLYIDSLSKAYGDIKKIPYAWKQSELKRLDDQLSWLKNDSEALNKRINDLGSFTEAAHETKLSGIEKQQQEMSLVTDQVLAQMSDWNRSLIWHYTTIINLVYLLLFIVIGVLGIFLNRIVRKDLRFMLEGIRLLSQYDTRKENLPALNPLFKEESEVLSRVEEIFDEQNFLNDLKSMSNQYYVLDDVLDQLFLMVQPIMAVDRLGIAFIEESSETITAEYAIANYGYKRLKAGYTVPLASTSLRQLAERKIGAIEGDLRTVLNQRPDSHSLQLIVDEGIQSNMIIPLLAEDEVYGFLFFSALKKQAYTEVSMRVGKNISHELSAMINKTFLMKKVFSTMTRTFARLVEQKDQVTGNHVNRMTAYATLLASALLSSEREGYKVKPDFVRDIQNDASIHDIGKVAIPDHILKKPGKYTPEEFEAMKAHAAVGGDILYEMQQQLKHFKTSFYQTAIDIAKYHHERFDGSGYPEGKSGADIPLAARIVAIADVFDALTSRRPYKEPYNFDDAVKIIKESAGTHFDPVLVGEFLKLLPQIKRIYERSEDRL